MNWFIKLSNWKKITLISLIILFAFSLVVGAIVLIKLGGVIGLILGIIFFMIVGSIFGILIWEFSKKMHKVHEEKVLEKVKSKSKIENANLPKFENKNENH